MARFYALFLDSIQRCIEHLGGTKTLQAGIFFPPVKRYNFQIASDFVQCLQLFSAFINSGVFLRCHPFQFCRILSQLFTMQM